MAENRFSCGMNDKLPQKNETVAVETNRILDSCRDKDCFEDVKVVLTDFGNEILEHSTSVRAKNACIAWTYIGTDPIKFNRGFYSVNIRFYVKITFEACLCGGKSQEFDGMTVLEKRVVLYGGESNISIFKSDPNANDFCAIPEPCCSMKNLPIAIVEVVDPVILNSKVREPEEICCKCCCCCNDIPEAIAGNLNGHLTDSEGRYITVSLGLFSVIRLVRPSQYLIHAAEYCVPEKECVSAEEDDPCAIFRTMSFPTSEFCPSGYNGERKCGCGS